MSFTATQAAGAIKNFTFEKGNTKVAAVVGGTTGIGEEVACLLAKIGCSRILVFGRNETRAQNVIERMNSLDPSGQHEFVKGDLSDVKGMKASAEALIQAAGSAGLNYVFLLQNGVPSGTIRENADGEEVGFAVQSQSRFVIAYLLTTRGALAQNAVVMSIANPGIALGDLDVEDLSLKKRFAAGRSRAMFFMDQSKRDSSVIDSVTWELNARYPQYRYLHLHPGLVKTANVANWGSAEAPLPFPWSFIFPLGYMAVSQTPAQYAPGPVYLAIHPSAEANLGTGKYFDSKLRIIQPGSWAQQAHNREAVWNKLMSSIG